MKEIYVFLVSGFEEIEALSPVDILRRAGMAVKTVSLEESRTVEGSHGIGVRADMMFSAFDLANARMLVLPGGTVRIAAHEGLRAAVAKMAGGGGWIAAICAAPMMLGQLGLLEGRRATCYPGFEQYLTGATVTKDPVVTDRKIITGRGPGMAAAFSLEIVEQLEGRAARDKVAEALLLK